MKPASDTLSRFIEAQGDVYAQALAEIEAGRKSSHWIWYVFPQLRGLGFSAMSHRYGIAGEAEALAYLADPILARRLKECVRAMLLHAGLSAADILGRIDAMKFHSSLTLFAAVATNEPLFAEALDRFFDGRRDEATLKMLDDNSSQG